MSETTMNPVVDPNTPVVAPAATAPATDKPKRARNKKSKSIYEAPTGGFQSALTPDFDVDTHKKLTAQSFADPLDHAKWEVWYFEQKLGNARKSVTQLESLGSTPEERKAAAESQRLLKALENLQKKMKQAGNVKGASALAERVGDVFTQMTV